MESQPQPIIPYSQPYVQTISVDESQLRMLAIFHYVLGGLTMLGSCLAIFYLVMGIIILRGGFNTFAAATPPGTGVSTTQQAMIDQQMHFMGLMFTIVASVILLLGETTGFLLIYSGRSIAKHRRRMFSLIIAGLSCINFPLGTTLGVLTLIVLLKPSMIELYATTPKK